MKIKIGLLPKIYILKTAMQFLFVSRTTLLINKVLLRDVYNGSIKSDLLYSQLQSSLSRRIDK